MKKELQISIFPIGGFDYVAYKELLTQIKELETASQKFKLSDTFFTKRLEHSIVPYHRYQHFIIYEEENQDIKKEIINLLLKSQLHFKVKEVTMGETKNE